MSIGSAAALSRSPWMTKFANRIIEILRNAPNGLTAKEVAERLGATRSNIGSQLSKLAAYGIIKKARGRVSAKVAAGALYRAPSHDAS